MGAGERNLAAPYPCHRGRPDLANAIALVVQAIRERRRSAIILAVLGLVGVVFAGFNGASFLDFNYDFSSMLMSTGFALTLVCDVALVVNGLVQQATGPA